MTRSLKFYKMSKQNSALKVETAQLERQLQNFKLLEKNFLASQVEYIQERLKRPYHLSISPLFTPKLPIKRTDFKNENVIEMAQPSLSKVDSSLHVGATSTVVYETGEKKPFVYENFEENSNHQNEEKLEPSFRLLRNKEESECDFVLWCLDGLRNTQLTVNEVVSLLKDERNVTKIESVLDGVLNVWDSVSPSCSFLSGAGQEPQPSVYEKALLSVIHALQFHFQKDLVSLLLDGLLILFAQTLNMFHVLDKTCRLPLLRVFCRSYAGLCKMSSDIHRLRILTCDILMVSFAPVVLLLFQAVSSVWPDVFGSFSDVLLTTQLDRFLSSAIAASVGGLAVSFAQKISKNNQEVIKLVLQDYEHLALKYSWEKITDPTYLKSVFLPHSVTLFRKLSFAEESTEPVRLSEASSNFVLGFSIVISAIIKEEGWNSAYNAVVVRHIIPLLKEGNCSFPTIAAIIKLLGFIGSVGLTLAKSPEATPLTFIRDLVTAFFNTSKATFIIKLTAAEALLKLNFEKKHSRVLQRWACSLPEEQYKLLGEGLQLVAGRS
ncbi:uncharacterized protein LOC135120977 [Zophobas morio]|uniref:uncharacterized protein LOC135120977 n=1 Tax=Zophobas morio TaxID=2755281 RepID=UPI003082D3AF